MTKKKIIIIVSAIFSFFVIVFLGLIIYYNVSLNSKSKLLGYEPIIVTIENGMGSKQVVDLLYDENLLNNKMVGYVYVKLHKGIILQAGKYEFNKGMSFKEIISDIKNGKVVDESISVTFVEGKRLVNYIKVISDNFDIEEEEILEKLEDKDYLNELIDKYWFLTDDILNDKLYYALEGYLYPDTYHFNQDANIESIIDKMLVEMGTKLSPFKDDIEKSSYSIHELLTLSSIIELEGTNHSDRKGVAGVFYNRLNSGMSLGSDVTAYYAARVEMSERDLYPSEIEDINDYNTRTIQMAGKLPVGPICSPGIDSIEAAINPEENDYFYFVADKNQKTYFNKTNEEHLQTIAKLKKEGLWYEYN